jgi:hypothetical protein
MSDSKNKAQPDPRPSTIRVGIDVGGHQRIEYVSDDADVISSVSRQLALAKPDLEPARYVVLGDLRIQKPSGSTVYYSLFLPIGHYKHKDRYYVTDFSPLFKRIRVCLDDTQALVKQPQSKQGKNGEVSH